MTTFNYIASPVMRVLSAAWTKWLHSSSRCDPVAFNVETGCFREANYILLFCYWGREGAGEEGNEWVRIQNPPSTKLTARSRWLIGEKITIAHREFAILDTLGRYAPYQTNEFIRRPATVSWDDFKQNWKNFQQDPRRIKGFHQRFQICFSHNPSCKGMESTS